jgi:hypothetical protein
MGKRNAAQLLVYKKRQQMFDEITDLRQTNEQQEENTLRLAELKTYEEL